MALPAGDEGRSGSSRTAERPTRYRSLSSWTPENQQAASSLASGSYTAPTTAAAPAPSWDPLGVSAGNTAPRVGYDPLGVASGTTAPRVGWDPLGVASTSAPEAKPETIGDVNRANRAASLKGGALTPADTERMSWKDYNALTPQQRAAVDFNTLLVSAVRKDTRLQDEYKPTETQQATYDKALEKMFGDVGRGSDTYAPETLGVLRQIDYHDTSADLDDFLKLKTAITSDDLKLIDVPKGVPMAVSQSGIGELGQEQLGLQRELANSTQAMEQELAKGNQLLATVQQSAAVERNFDVTHLGGYANKVNAALGYAPVQLDDSGAPADLNSYFQVSYDTLAKKGNAKDTDQILAAIDQALKPDEFQAFMNYANARSGNALRLGTDLGMDKEADYSTPEQFRTSLGLNSEVNYG